MNSNKFLLWTCKLADVVAAYISGFVLDAFGKQEIVNLFVNIYHIQLLFKTNRSLLQFWHMIGICRQWQMHVSSWQIYWTCGINLTIEGHFEVHRKHVCQLVHGTVKSSRVFCRTAVYCVHDTVTSSVLCLTSVYCTCTVPSSRAFCRTLVYCTCTVPSSRVFCRTLVYCEWYCHVLPCLLSYVSVLYMILSRSPVSSVVLQCTVHITVFQCVF